ncbi:sensor histidine kinase [Streptomyces scabiei]|uniref:sensor histidine kinase n=5 Tax=Streptomyces scabiei TaxID=1930 RepID=UPI00056945B8|nr:MULTISPECIES: histidine kinase [Streptomyces]MBP5892631.1 two-component sensor histidine kinase [Streptomyces sp. LBUM 1481]MBP5922898.1 two-component sensor histidine kinase [Streptomyces sp. LBUM 1483]MDX2751640.1 histidine kinase [Streptomyces scabiei]MDX2805828.1 histidine kinase [Streptomyces scabiei]MDX2834320.1 histidine kinase [Streptomyces scabiei]
MRGPGTWWRVKSTPAKVETYTRWSFHMFAGIELLAAGLPAFAEVGPGRPAGWLLLLLVSAHAATCAVTASRALDWTRGRRAQPVRLLWVLTGVTALIAVLTFVIADHGVTGDVADNAGIFGIVVVFGVGNVTLGIRGRRQVLGIVGGFAAGSALLLLLLRAPVADALIASMVVVISGGALAFTAVFSVWLLDAVYELADARETRARLAVAEERLRFGRDLHDVIGRNLAVIALKSELAVQLARRERPEAVEQMIEVQRIAHDSQREVREVVRGYREADLGVELAGAQGVLAAAGIDCTVDGAEAAGLPGEVQSALAWVVREGTTNVLRHGNAVRCAVMLKVTEGQVVLTVENDGMRTAGAQADAGRPVGAGSGLAGLRERLAVVDGTLEAGPVGGEAFRVVARVPLGPAGPWASSAPGAESAAVSGTAARGSSAAAVAGGAS